MRRRLGRGWAPRADPARCDPRRWPARRPTVDPAEVTSAECISGPKRVSNEFRAAPDEVQDHLSGAVLLVLVGSRFGGCRLLVAFLLAERLALVVCCAVSRVAPALQEGVELAFLVGDLAASGRRQQRRRKLGCFVGWRRALALVEEGVELLACRERLERLAGQRLERRPAGPLALRGHVRRRASPGRDQLADDDVLLEADQVVARAVDGGLGEHPGRLLEGRRGEEARGVERSLRHAEQNGLRRGGLAALGEEGVFLLLEAEAVVH